MEKLVIKPTKSTMGVSFDPLNHTFDFHGVSYPSDPITFFAPLINWVEDYLFMDTKTKITLNFKLTYFNTTSSTYLFRILELFDACNKKYCNVKLIWHYENSDDDALEAWKSLLSDLDLPYEIKI